MPLMPHRNQHHHQRGLEGESDIGKRDDQQTGADHAKWAEVTADLATEEMPDAVNPEEDRTQGAYLGAADIQRQRHKRQDHADVHPGPGRTERR